MMTPDEIIAEMEKKAVACFNTDEYLGAVAMLKHMREWFAIQELTARAMHTREEMEAQGQIWGETRMQKGLATDLPDPQDTENK